MTQPVERRRTARLPVPSKLGCPGVGRHQVRLLDLSRDCARIEHAHPLPDRGLCS